MKSKHLLAALIMGSLFAINADAREEKKFKQEYDFDQSGRVSIDNVNGNIKIEAWDKDSVLLEYTILADSEKDLKRISVDVNASSNHFNAEVDFAKSSSWFSSGTSGEVSFSLKVPSEAILKTIESVNGNIRVNGVKGDITTETVNGKIHVKGAGSDVAVETVNGKVVIDMSQFSAKQKITADTVNGDIELSIPDNTGFKLRSETLNGSLSNEFGIEVDKGQYVGADMNGSYGDGTARLTFDTVNGDIEVNKK